MPPVTMGYQTAAEQAYEELRRRIVMGELQPSTPLPLVELANALGVSTTPVRNALSRLQTEGLVVHYRHRGTIVAPLDLEDLEVIQAVRAGIEGKAALLGAPRLTDSTIEEMQSTFERLQRAASSVDTFLPLNWTLHDLCYSAGGRKRLLDLIHSYQRRAERYIRLAIQDEAGRSTSLAQQSEFVDACAARDGVRAEEIMREALQYTIAQLEPLVPMPVDGGASDEKMGRETNGGL